LYSTYLSEGNDGKGSSVKVFMIKSNGAGKRELGRVKRLKAGPVYLRRRNAFVFTGDTIGQAIDELAHTYLYDVATQKARRLFTEIDGYSLEKSDDERYLYMSEFHLVYQYDFKKGKLKKLYGANSFNGYRIGSDGKTLLTTGLPRDGNAMEVIRHDMVTGEKEAVIPGDKSVWKYWFSGDLKVFFGNISPFKGDTTKIFTGRIDDRGSWKKRVINTGGYNIFHTGRLDRNGKYYYAWDGMFFSRIKVSDCVFRRLFRTDRVIGKFTLAE